MNSMDSTPNPVFLPPTDDGHLVAPEVASIALALDGLGARDRAAAIPAMSHRIARASMTALAGAAQHDESELQQLASTASVLDAQGRRDRALAGPAMSARIAEGSSPALADQGHIAIIGHIGIRRWRLAAAVAIGAVGIGATALFMSSPPTIPPIASTAGDDAFESSAVSPALNDEWATAITLDESASLSEFDSNILSAATMLDDPWGELDDLFSEGAL